MSKLPVLLSLLSLTCLALFLETDPRGESAGMRRVLLTVVSPIQHLLSLKWKGDRTKAALKCSRTWEFVCSTEFAF
jgi:hypothetical protein